MYRDACYKGVHMYVALSYGLCWLPGFPRWQHPIELKGLIRTVVSGQFCPNFEVKLS